MALMNMIADLRGEIPGLPAAKAKTNINQALGFIYDEQMWSFQLQTGGWLTPGLIGASGTQSSGTITVSPYAMTIVGDSVASAVWLAMTGRPFITELQIRIPYYSLYNVIAMDSTVPTAVVLTIDRPWMEPAQVNSSYMLYQAYFPVPVQDFKRFFDIRDTRNNQVIDFSSMSQADLAVKDPQRICFNQPAFAVPFQTDTRVGSSTLGWMLYELWNHPLSVLPYTFQYLRRGPQLVNRDDTVPYPLTEEIVGWRAKEVSYLWKEAQTGEDSARGSGADWKFLAQAAHAQYQLCLKEAKRKDEDIVQLYFHRLQNNLPNQAPYATITGMLNVGRF
jgi:hypothetical protein